MSPNAQIDRYVDAIFSRYQTILREYVATLAQPAVTDVARACHCLERMIETVTAFAVGHAVGRVVEAMRRIDRDLEAPIAEVLTTVKLPALTANLLPPLRFVADASLRPLVDDLAGRLNERLALAARQARILVRAIATAVGARRSELANALHLLAIDPTAAFAFGDQLALGWRFLVAVITDTADPAVPDEPRWQRGSALWSAWSRRIRGIRTQEREYILRVA